MSVSSAQAFLRKSESDPDFKAHILAILGTGDMVREYIKKHGFDFTYDDLREAISLNILPKNSSIKQKSF